MGTWAIVTSEAVCWNIDECEKIGQMKRRLISESLIPTRASSQFNDENSEPSDTIYTQTVHVSLDL